MTKTTNRVFRKQAREMILDVYAFMKQEAENGVSNLKQIQKRTALATNCSIATVKRIVKEGKTSIIKTPGKKRARTKYITGIDSTNIGIIKRVIHNYHITEKETPTMEKLRIKLQKVISYPGSTRSLTRIINNIGFKWKRTQNNKEVLLEKSNVRFKRITYLQDITKYRREGRPIIYTDESFFDSTESTPVPTMEGSNMRLRKPISKGQKVVMVLAGSETNFVPNTLLLFVAGDKSSENHDILISTNYEKWVQNQLVPNLPDNSVVVVDNAPYHNKRYAPAPTSNAKKAEMQAWLTEKHIEFNKEMLKPQLYNLIQLYKDEGKKFSIDKILEEHGHTVLRLPPDEADLNPFEMAWTAVKDYVNTKNTIGNVKGVKDLIIEKLQLMNTEDWAKLCETVKVIEEQYIKSDRAVDSLTEKYIIRGDDESDNNDDDTSDSEYEDNNQSNADDSNEDTKPGTSLIAESDVKKECYIYVTIKEEPEDD